MILSILTILLWTTVIPFLLAVALYIDAKNGWHATFIPEGNIAFIVKGESLERIIPNIKGKTLSETGELISGNQTKWFWEKYWGLYWVSFFYPWKKIHKFTISKDSLKDSVELGKEHGIRDWVEHEDGEVNTLRWRFFRPFVIEGVDLGGDRARVNLLVMMTFEMIDPYIPIFVYKGAFFSLLEASVRSALIDFCGEGTLTYERFVKVPKSSGSNLSDRLIGINWRSEKAPEGIVKAFGIEAVDAWVHDFDLVPEDKAFIDAARAEELEKLRARATVEEAEGKKEARKRIGEGDGEWFNQTVGQLIDRGVSPDVAAHIAGQQIRMESVRDSGLRTLVEGGAAVPAIQVPVATDDEEGDS